MADFLEEKHRQITARLEELKPLVDEYSRLEAAAAALADVDAISSVPAAGPTARRRGPGRPRGAASGRGGSAAPKPGAKPAPKPARPEKRRAGPRKGSGKRAAEALSLVQAQPGITIPELAAKMGIKQNYLYRVLPDLARDRKLERLGRGWAVRDCWDGWDLGP